MYDYRSSDSKLSFLCSCERRVQRAQLNFRPVVLVVPRQNVTRGSCTQTKRDWNLSQKKRKELSQTDKFTKCSNCLIFSIMGHYCRPGNSSNHHPGLFWTVRRITSSTDRDPNSLYCAVSFIAPTGEVHPHWPLGLQQTPQLPWRDPAVVGTLAVGLLGDEGPPVPECVVPSLCLVPSPPRQWHPHPGETGHEEVGVRPLLPGLHQQHSPSLALA